jgi:hypothetical protein
MTTTMTADANADANAPRQLQQQQQLPQQQRRNGWLRGAEVQRPRVSVKSP